MALIFWCSSLTLRWFQNMLNRRVKGSILVTACLLPQHRGQLIVSNAVAFLGPGRGCCIQKVLVWGSLLPWWWRLKRESLACWVLWSIVICPIRLVVVGIVEYGSLAVLGSQKGPIWNWVGFISHERQCILLAKDRLWASSWLKILCNTRIAVQNAQLVH